MHYNIITSFQPPRADEMILPIDGIGVKLQAPRTNRAAQILSGCHQRRVRSLHCPPSWASVCHGIKVPLLLYRSERTLTSSLTVSIQVFLGLPFGHIPSFHPKFTSVVLQQLYFSLIPLWGIFGIISDYRVHVQVKQHHMQALRALVSQVMPLFGSSMPCTTDISQIHVTAQQLVMAGACLIQSVSPDP